MNGKIYKLQCEDGHYYIGSTTSELRFRFFGHKTRAKKHPDRRIYAHILGLGWDKVKIILIEEFECKTRQELYQKEDEHIRRVLHDELCLNHYKVMRTHEEQLVANREQYHKHKDNKTEEQKQKQKEYKAQWYSKLSEEQKQKRREYGNRHYANLTEEQREHRKKLTRDRYHKQKIGK